MSGLVSGLVSGLLSRLVSTPAGRPAGGSSRRAVMLGAMLAAIAVHFATASAVGLSTAQPEGGPAGPGVRFNIPLEQELKQGHLTLVWITDSEGGEHQLEYAATADFADSEVWYQGSQAQSFVSGLGAGEHYYRVRTRESEDGAWGPWSEPLHVTVELQSMATAWSFFAVGAVMFVCILGFIVWHALRDEPRAEGAA